MITLSVRGYMNEMKSVILGLDNLVGVDTPQLRETYQYLEQHPEETFLISEQNPIVVGWLTYHARRANVFLDRSVMSEQDPDLPPPGLPFFSLPVRGATIINRAGTRKDGIAWRVINPQGRDQDSSGSWYWLGDLMDVIIDNFRREPIRVELLLEVISGPANPDPERVIALGVNSAEQQLRFSGHATLRTTMELKPGSNRVHIRTVRPLEHLVKFPGDPRKHMVRFNRIAVDVSP